VVALGPRLAEILGRSDLSLDGIELAGVDVEQRNLANEGLVQGRLDAQPPKAQGVHICDHQGKGEG
jgi:hypothetical protein